MNITEIDESYDNGGGNVNHLYTYFDVDDLNKVTSHRTKKYLSLAGKWQWTKREHGYDAPGRLVNTTMKQWYDGDSEPAGDSLEHIYDKGRMLQNYDGSSAYGDQWRWAGTQNSNNSPLHSPNADTASQTGYNLSNDKTPQRRSFLSPTTEGDQRNLYGQGKPQAKDSTGGGASWYVGVTSQPTTVHHAAVESRLFFEGTVTATDMDRATDTREKGRIGITGSAQSYGGSNGRMTSEAIGRDINPLGRGGGAALVGGMMNVGRLAPRLPGSSGGVNQGNSVNNECSGCGTTISILPAELWNYITFQFRDWKPTTPPPMVITPKCGVDGLPPRNHNVNHESICKENCQSHISSRGMEWVSRCNACCDVELVAVDTQNTSIGTTIQYSLQSDYSAIGINENTDLQIAFPTNSGVSHSALTLGYTKPLDWECDDMNEFYQDKRRTKCETNNSKWCKLSPSSASTSCSIYGDTLREAAIQADCYACCKKSTTCKDCCLEQFEALAFAWGYCCV